jgi:hypothetical protein
LGIWQFGTWCVYIPTKSGHPFGNSLFLSIFAAMRFVFIISCSVLLLLAAVPKSLMVGLYWVQQDFIVEQYCVNVIKPQLDCSGRCFLSDQLQQEQEDKSAPLPDFSQLNEVSHFISQSPILQTFCLQKQKSSLVAEVPSRRSLLLPGAVWRPPIA